MKASDLRIGCFIGGLSNTYEVATSDITKNTFQLDYEDGEGVS